MARKKSIHYVNNKQMLEALTLYREKRLAAEAAGTELPRAPDYIGKCLMLICERLSHKLNFINYSYRDEMVGDAIENCIQAIDSFDPKKSSFAFAYFTRIAWNAMIRRIQKEKKQSYIKHKSLEESVINDLMSESSDGDDKKSSHKFFETSYRIINEFEEKHLTKSKKRYIIGLEKFASITDV